MPGNGDRETKEVVVLKWPRMRTFAVVCLAIFFLVSVGCGPILQPAAQGEWSNVHSDKDKVTQNARPEKPAGEK